MVDFSNISLPFNVYDLLSSSFNIVALFGSFILAVIVSKFVPELIELLKDVFWEQKSRKVINRTGWAGGGMTKRQALRNAYRNYNYRKRNQ